MSEQIPLEPSPSEFLAAEYALGLLDGGDLVQAQRQRLAEPSFAREIEAWETRLAGLAEAAEAIAPPEGLWARICARLAAEDSGTQSGVVLRLRRSLAVWRGATAMAAGLAACLVVAIALPRPAPAPSPVMTARLSASATGPAVFVALYDPGRRAIVLTPAELHAPAGRSPELWLIPPGGKPVALGMADFAGSVQLISTQRLEGMTAGALAISVEPKGGSPTGQPTGPVIATGQLSRL